METIESEPWENFPATPDLEIIIGDSIIKCHKIMLQFRSPVFRSMFDANMLENNTNKLTIEDIDKKTFLIFLRHLYSPEKVLQYEDLSMELLKVANKYMVRSLLEHFNEHSENFINIYNAIECAIVASQNDSPWRYKLVSFIAQHYKQLKDRENFKFLINDFHLTIDLLNRMDLCSRVGLSSSHQLKCEVVNWISETSKLSPDVLLIETSADGHTDKWKLSYSLNANHDLLLKVNNPQCRNCFKYIVDVNLEIKYDNSRTLSKCETISVTVCRSGQVCTVLEPNFKTMTIRTQLSYWKVNF